MSLKQCKTGPRLLWRTNRKSYTRFRSYRNRWPWMTLKGRNALLRKKSFYGAHQKNLNKDRPILSATKCRPMILSVRLYVRSYHDYNRSCYFKCSNVITGLQSPKIGSLIRQEQPKILRGIITVGWLVCSRKLAIFFRRCKIGPRLCWNCKLLITNEKLHMHFPTLVTLNGHYTLYIMRLKSAKGAYSALPDLLAREERFTTPPQNILLAVSFRPQISALQF